MIRIEQLTVQPLKVDRMRITWKFNQTLDSFTDYRFELQRSLSPEDEFMPIHTFVDSVEFVDEVEYRRIWNNVYYRIVVTHIATQQQWTYGPSRVSERPNLEALEIIRRNDILLKNKRHGIGVPVAVFIQKRDGISCKCWDPNKKRSTTADCEDCYGSRYDGGFYAPIITWVNMTPDGKSAPIPQWGEIEPNETRIFVSNYPVLLPKDVIFDTGGMLAWTVETVETTARRGHMLHQLVNLNVMDRKNVIYKLLDKHPDLVERVADAARRIEVS